MKTSFNHTKKHDGVRGKSKSPQEVSAHTRVKPSDPLVSQNKAISGDVHLESLLACMEGTALVPGKEIGLLEVDPGLFLYDFDSSWSSIANV